MKNLGTYNKKEIFLVYKSLTLDILEYENSRYMVKFFGTYDGFCDATLVWNAVRPRQYSLQYLPICGHIKISMCGSSLSFPHQ